MKIAKKVAIILWNIFSILLVLALKVFGLFLTLLSLILSFITFIFNSFISFAFQGIGMGWLKAIIDSILKYLYIPLYIALFIFCVFMKKNPFGAATTEVIILLSFPIIALILSNISFSFSSMPFDYFFIREYNQVPKSYEETDLDDI